MGTTQLAGKEKGRPVYDLEEVVADTAGHVLVLTGCRKGTVRQELEPRWARRRGCRAPWPGRAVRPRQRRRRLSYAALPTDAEVNDALAGLAADMGLPTVATAASSTTPLRSGFRWPRRWPRSARGVASTRPTAGCRPRVPRTCGPGAEMAAPVRRPLSRCGGAGGASSARSVRSRSISSLRTCPRSRHPPGISEAKEWLRELTRRGVLQRYGSFAEYPEAVATVERELEVIEARKFSGYFLIVHDIVAFCRASGILCQGRGSAANSAVCYALGITNVDAVSHGLLFERFLSPARDGYPDIDLDIESGPPGGGHPVRLPAATGATGRPGGERDQLPAPSAVRDVARALGFSPGQQDAWSKQIERWTGRGRGGMEGGEV